MSNNYADWRDRLTQANDPDFFPITFVDEVLTDGRARFWCDGRAALVTIERAYPGGALCVEALAAAGDMEALVETIEPALCDYARAIGATHLRVEGRTGWPRILKRAGWTHDQAVLFKDMR